jgi:hypothetical protein
MINTWSASNNGLSLHQSETQTIVKAPCLKELQTHQHLSVQVPIPDYFLSIS